MSNRNDSVMSPSKSEARSIARSLAFANDTSHRRSSPVLRHVVPGRPLEIPPSVLRRADVQAASRAGGRRPVAAPRAGARRPVAAPRLAVPRLADLGNRTAARPSRPVASPRVTTARRAGATTGASRPATAGGGATRRPVTAPSTPPSTPPSSAGGGMRPSFAGGDVRLLTRGAAALAPAVAPTPSRRATADAPARPERTLRVVPAPSARRFRLRGTTLAGVALVAVAFLAVTMHASLAENQLRLDHVNNSIAIAERRNQVLRLDVAQLEAPERVVSEAQRLGLRSPQQVTFLSSGAGPAATVPVIPPAVRTASTVPAPDASPKRAATLPSASGGPVSSVAAGADTTVLATSMAASQSTVPLAGGRVPRESTR